MNESCRNIYQLARNVAGLTQIEASERLGVSVRALGNYELGNTIPHGDIVADMATVYGAKWLGYEHLRLSTKLGQEILPEIDITDIAKSVLVLQKESGDVDDVKPCMIKIACDGRIDRHEEDRWDEVTKEVFEMAGAALSVVFSR
ncbi:helix-turn-helix transcriptional regulator [Tissierella sp. MB52-C2]|uniref:helix-turn-helix domain-containing protein n=1 Tax=Tissierella sp. MB52-C2 TaxID=3070999 RepID=UPI00280BA360|nr:helix-turn-helix transcriptional regulator [Tissierella sp. MB52-C2]WMM26699.1 helix-turn-helix transcriptional regulator [Tissierella sp. MB52-C2]